MIDSYSEHFSSSHSRRVCHWAAAGHQRPLSSGPASAYVSPLFLAAAVISVMSPAAVSLMRASANT